MLREGSEWPKSTILCMDRMTIVKCIVYLRAKHFAGDVVECGEQYGLGSKTAPSQVIIGKGRD